MFRIQHRGNYSDLLLLKKKKNKIEVTVKHLQCKHILQCKKKTLKYSFSIPQTQHRHLDYLKLQCKGSSDRSFLQYCDTHM